MIINEYYTTRPDNVRLFRTYSDADMRILQVDTGIEYDEAIDVEGTSHTYEETSNPIEHGFLAPQEALNMVFGEGVEQ